jgi:virginiamycin A acetyltransferase
MPFPDPDVPHPMPDQPRVVLLKPLVTSPLIEVGEYSYYDDPDDPTAFETRNVLYHYGPELAEGAGVLCCVLRWGGDRSR